MNLLMAKQAAVVAKASKAMMVVKVRAPMTTRLERLVKTGSAAAM